MRRPVTLSLKKELVEQIDEERGLITRSRFIEALLEKQGVSLE